MTGIPGPDDASPALEPLHPRAVPLWRLESALRGAVFVAGAVVAELIADLPVPAGTLTAAVAVLASLHAWLVPPLRYRAWGYVVRARDVYLRHGVLVRTTSIVPHARIQHVDTRHGPIDRRLGLAQLILFTAGTRGAIIAIPGLGAERAEELRDRLAGLSGAGDAV